MPKLDKTYSSTFSFHSQKKESDHYSSLTVRELFEVFNYLNSTAYNYPMSDPPKMDKTIFSCR